jgi:hypothetical protein
MFSFALKNLVTWYEPYQKLLPTDQVTLLQLWDEIGIPHAENKQISGAVLPCIGFEVDPNKMSVYMSPEKRQKLIEACSDFTHQGSRRTLREFWRLQGYVNWALNVYPRLRPALSAMYAKTAGKTKGRAYLRVNKRICSEMSWFIKHIQQSSGVHMLKAVEWSQSDGVKTLTVYSDASGVGMGVWFSDENVAYQASLPDAPPGARILFFEALAACSAIHLSTRFAAVGRISLYTDSSNTFDIFNSFAALPLYNPILQSSVDILGDSRIDLRVHHIAGEDNVVADLISRLKNDEAMYASPGLTIHPFTPPRDALGAVAC